MPLPSSNRPHHGAMVSRLPESTTSGGKRTSESTGRGRRPAAPVKLTEPRVVSPLKDQLFRPGDRVGFECTIEGAPAPTVKWYKDEALLFPSEKSLFQTHGNNHQLIILCACARDEGEYTCRAKNSYGAEATTALLVDADSLAKQRAAKTEASAQPQKASGLSDSPGHQTAPAGLTSRSKPNLEPSSRRTREAFRTFGAASRGPRSTESTNGEGPTPSSLRRPAASIWDSERSPYVEDQVSPSSSTPTADSPTGRLPVAISTSASAVSAKTSSAATPTRSRLVAPGKSVLTNGSLSLNGGNNHTRVSGESPTFRSSPTDTVDSGPIVATKASRLARQFDQSPSSSQSSVSSKGRSDIRASLPATSAVKASSGLLGSSGTQQGKSSGTSTSPSASGKDTSCSSSNGSISSSSSGAKREVTSISKSQPKPGKSLLLGKKFSGSLQSLSSSSSEKPRFADELAKKAPAVQSTYKQPQTGTPGPGSQQPPTNSGPSAQPSSLAPTNKAQSLTTALGQPTSGVSSRLKSNLSALSKEYVNDDPSASATSQENIGNTSSGDSTSESETYGSARGYSSTDSLHTAVSHLSSRFSDRQFENSSHPSSLSSSSPASSIRSVGSLTASERSLRSASSSSGTDSGREAAFPLDYPHSARRSPYHSAGGSLRRSQNPSVDTLVPQASFGGSGSSSEVFSDVFGSSSTSSGSEDAHQRVTGDDALIRSLPAPLLQKASARSFSKSHSLTRGFSNRTDSLDTIHSAPSPDLQPVSELVPHKLSESEEIKQHSSSEKVYPASRPLPSGSYSEEPASPSPTFEKGPTSVRPNRPSLTSSSRSLSSESARSEPRSRLPVKGLVSRAVEGIQSGHSISKGSLSSGSASSKSASSEKAAPESSKPVNLPITSPSRLPTTTQPLSTKDPSQSFNRVAAPFVRQDLEEARFIEEAQKYSYFHRTVEESDSSRSSSRASLAKAKTPPYSSGHSNGSQRSPPLLSKSTTSLHSETAHQSSGQTSSEPKGGSNSGSVQSLRVSSGRRAKTPQESLLSQSSVESTHHSVSSASRESPKFPGSASSRSSLSSWSPKESFDSEVSSVHYGDSTQSVCRSDGEQPVSEVPRQPAASRLEKDPSGGSSSGLKRLGSVSPARSTTSQSSTSSASKTSSKSAGVQALVARFADKRDNSPPVDFGVSYGSAKPRLTKHSKSLENLTSDNKSLQLPAQAEPGAQLQKSSASTAQARSLLKSVVGKPSSEQKSPTARRPSQSLDLSEKHLGALYTSTQQVDSGFTPVSPIEVQSPLSSVSSAYRNKDQSQRSSSTSSSSSSTSGGERRSLGTATGLAAGLQLVDKSERVGQKAPSFSETPTTSEFDVPSGRVHSQGLSTARASVYQPSNLLTKAQGGSNIRLSRGLSSDSSSSSSSKVKRLSSRFGSSRFGSSSSVLSSAKSAPSIPELSDSDTSAGFASKPAPVPLSTVSATSTGTHSSSVSIEILSPPSSSAQRLQSDLILSPTLSGGSSEKEPSPIRVTSSAPGSPPKSPLQKASSPSRLVFTRERVEVPTPTAVVGAVYTTAPGFQITTARSKTPSPTGSTKDQQLHSVTDSNLTASVNSDLQVSSDSSACLNSLPLQSSSVAEEGKLSAPPISGEASVAPARSDSLHHTLPHQTKEEVVKDKEANLTEDKPTAKRKPSSLPLPSSTTDNMRSLPGRPPMYIIKPRAQFVDVGGTATMKCAVDGEPLPTVTWSLNRQEIQPSSRVKMRQEKDYWYITISPVEASDRGTYSCVATNDHGSASAFATVDVTEPRKAKKTTSRSYTRTKAVADLEKPLSGASSSDRVSSSSSTRHSRSNDRRSAFDSGDDVMTQSASSLSSARSSGVSTGRSSGGLKARLHELSKEYQSEEEEASRSAVALSARGDNYQSPAASLSLRKKGVGLGQPHSGDITDTNSYRAPAFLKNLSDQEVYEGDRVTLKCRMSASAPVTERHAGQAPRFTHELGDHEVSEGDSVTIQVTSGGRPRSGSGAGRERSAHVDRLINRPNFERRQRIKTIIGTEESSSGNATSGGEKPTAPRFVRNLQDGSLTEGDSITIECKSGGSARLSGRVPRPEPPHFVKDLEDSSLTEGDSVTIECKSSGGDGRSFIPRLPEPPRFVTGLGQTDDEDAVVTLQEGEDVTIECHGEVPSNAGQAPKFVQNLGDVTVAEGDSVTLECQSSASRAVPQPSAPQFTRDLKDSTVMEGDDVTIECHADSNSDATTPLMSAPLFVKELDDFGEVSLGDNLTIDCQTSVEHRADAEGGSSRRTPARPPVFTLPLVTDMEVAEGDSVTIGCRSSFIPEKFSPTRSPKSLKFIQESLAQANGSEDKTPTGSDGNAVDCPGNLPDADDSPVLPEPPKPDRHQSSSEEEETQLEGEDTFPTGESLLKMADTPLSSVGLMKPSLQLPALRRTREESVASDRQSMVNECGSAMQSPLDLDHKGGVFQLHDENDNVSADVDEDDDAFAPDSGHEEEKKAPQFVTSLANIVANEGEGIELLVITEGTLPIDVVWVHNTDELQPDHADYVQTSEGHVHKLTISDIFPEDAGTYICEAYNGEGECDTACEVTVIGKGVGCEPSLVKALPSTMCVTDGEDVVLQCQIDYVDPLDVTWSKNGRMARQGQRFKVGYDGDSFCYRIEGVLPTDGGLYECTGTNDIGSVSTKCQLDVVSSEDVPDVATFSYKDVMKQSRADMMKVMSHTKPKVSDGPADVQACVGSRVIVSCTVEAKPPADVRWSHDGVEIKNSPHTIINRQDDLAEVIIPEAALSDGGEYTLVASNDMGQVSHRCTVTVSSSKPMAKVPEAPVGQPFVTDVSSQGMTVAWYGPAYDGGSKVLSYKVEMCKCSLLKISQDKFWKTLTDQCKNTSYRVNNVVAEAEYLFRVRAVNALGEGECSDWSEPVVATDRRSVLPSDAESLMETESLWSEFSEYAESEYDVDLDEAFSDHTATIIPQRKFEDHYDTGDIIGKGKFGTVFLCYQRVTKRQWAAKRIKYRNSQRDDILNEVAIMNDLRHPKLLRLWDVFETNREITLVTEYVGGGELFERIVDDDTDLTETDCVRFSRQICEGIQYMHSHCILHLDLKPENVVCTRKDSNQIKLIDFGLARRFHKGQVLQVLFGTPEFVAPEVISFDAIDFTTDMWSIGVITYILLSGLSPFAGDSDQETLANVTKAVWDFDDDAFDSISELAKDFVSKLLCKKKENRMTAEQACAHPWMADSKGLRTKKLKKSKEKMRKFVARRKWQKTGNAIRAINRLGSIFKDPVAQQQILSSLKKGGKTPADPSAPVVQSQPSVPSPAQVTRELERVDLDTEVDADDQQSVDGEQCLTARKADPTTDGGSTPPIAMTTNRSQAPGAAGTGPSSKSMKLAESHDSGYEGNKRLSAESVLASNGGDTDSKHRGTHRANSSSSSHYSRGSSAHSLDPYAEEDVQQGSADDAEEEEVEPKFTSKAQEYRVNRGEDARFRAKLTDPRGVLFQWFKNGERLEEDNHVSVLQTAKSSTLLITAARSSDDAEYECRATNGAGEASLFCELFVGAPSSATR